MWAIETFLKIYYFNIIMIALIILGVMIISYNRMKSVVVNVGEKSTPLSENKKISPIVTYVVIYGLLFFTLREYGDDLIDFIKGGFEYLQELING